jgi:hypothetical protein
MTADGGGSGLYLQYPDGLILKIDENSEAGKKLMCSDTGNLYSL